MIDVASGGAIPLFVYGTLRDDARMAEVVGGGSEWSYIGSATVHGDVYDAGEYPALLLRDDAGRPVEGLLVVFSDPEAAFTALDAYEDVESRLFVRRRCRARLPDGSYGTVWVYEFVGSVEGLRFLDDRTRPPNSWRYRPRSN